MPVVAVVNRKGGSGKSTLATHLAAWYAHQGIPVMLGDVDKQQSTRAWLKLRDQQRTTNPAPIVGWKVDPRSVMRPPAGVNHVVLDTPGGLRGFELARVTMVADVILMPVCNSVFDRDSAAACHAELMSLPRVASGRCQVAAVGMRLDARTQAEAVLRAWAVQHAIHFVGVLRETQAYVRCVERGLTLFDLPAQQAQVDLAQWQPLLEWLAPRLQAPIAPGKPSVPVASAVEPTVARPVPPTPAQVQAAAHAQLDALSSAPARPGAAVRMMIGLLQSLRLARPIER